MRSRNGTIVMPQRNAGGIIRIDDSRACSVGPAGSAIMPLRAIPAAVNAGLSSGLTLDFSGFAQQEVEMRSNCPSNIDLPTIRSLIAVAAVATLAPANGAFAQETAKGLLAIQVRSQGQVCDNPISATRDKKQSSPDVSVWVLRCESNSYRVRLAPDMAARIQRLNNRSE
jgi:hypothetical protein